MKKICNLLQYTGTYLTKSAIRLLILHREFAPFLEVLLYRERYNARALTSGFVALGHTLGCLLLELLNLSEESFKYRFHCRICLVGYYSVIDAFAASTASCVLKNSSSDWTSTSLTPVASYAFLTRSCMALAASMQSFAN